MQLSCGDSFYESSMLNSHDKSTALISALLVLILCGLQSYGAHIDLVSTTGIKYIFICKICMRSSYGVYNVKYYYGYSVSEFEEHSSLFSAMN